MDINFPDEHNGWLNCYASPAREPYFERVHFVNEQLGWLTVGGSVYGTTDAGKSWSISFTGPASSRNRWPKLTGESLY